MGFSSTHQAAVGRKGAEEEHVSSGQQGVPRGHPRSHVSCAKTSVVFFVEQAMVPSGYLTNIAMEGMAHRNKSFT
jgi:hypothetical protein